jgi:hypothetical protein
MAGADDRTVAIGYLSQTLCSRWVVVHVIVGQNR